MSGRQNREPPGLERCVAEAAFSWSASGGPATYQIGVGGGMRHLHRHAAAWFARRYLAEHSRLPEGRHYVRVNAYARDHEVWGGIKNVYGGEKLVEVWVTYPPDPPPPDPVLSRCRTSPRCQAK